MKILVSHHYFFSLLFNGGFFVFFHFSMPFAEKYFENKDLIIVYFTSSPGSYYYELRNIKVGENIINIDINCATFKLNSIKLSCLKLSIKNLIIP